VSDPTDFKPPPLATELVDELDADRFSFIDDALTAASKFAAAGALAAERGDKIETALRAKQAISSLREAAEVIGTIGQPEVVE
jgi:hypothetical protein